MYKLIKKILFWFEPESVHTWVMNRLDFAYNVPFLRYFIESRYYVDEPSLSQTIWGIHFPNPVGLAAGFDKNAVGIDSLSCLGFGFIEIGTVTPRQQSGNLKPRLFRLPADEALINRMGFNNRGATSAASRIRKKKEAVVIGGNIGKNKDTPLALADADYERCFEELYKVVDYFVVNVSSPNTPGLRELQEREPLTRLLNKLQVLNNRLGSGKPILLKIAPDLTEGQLDDIIDIVRETEIHGIVATNTTIKRDGLRTTASTLESIGDGGLSGRPLKERATEVVRYIHSRSNGQIPIIAVGGIFTAEDAIEKLEAGACLVQVYTGFVYEGPS
ncbi:MAG: quinone-dependent dihydroorotate dehydrogenase, partial [Taibaiella sp.]|nr:quinone-dependent dihydroorotate dehydrogenase [Taibaiella sp.]